MTRRLLAIVRTLLLCAAGLCPAADSSALNDAVAALQHGDFAGAERTLRGEIAAHPDNAMALSLLGAALDNLKRPSEADTFHRRAVTKLRSVDILNNYATHLLLAGDATGAARIYREVLALDATQVNASLQLTQLALKRGDGKEALIDLGHLDAARRQVPQVLLLRLEAAYMSGDRVQGDEAAARLRSLAAGDVNLAVATSIALSRAREYSQAESFLESALRIDPSNFTVLYDLGAAASSAGHYDRASEVLESALREQPKNVDVLYALATANEASKQWERALELLAQACVLDPKRADIQKLIAVTATELGALPDAAAAWDRYLKLNPGDEAARRERALTASLMGDFAAGIEGIEAYVARHPNDAIGHYELAQAQKPVDTEKALVQLSRAIELDPNYEPARTARGSLYYQAGKSEAALRDLEAAASLRPSDAVNLDRLGQTYQALDRPADAVRVLRDAARLSPLDSRIQLHFGRALADAGNDEESKAAMDRFRQLGPEKHNGVPAGLVDYLALTPEQRRASYRARVDKAVREHPDDATVWLDYLKLAIEDGGSDRLEAAAGRLAALKPGTLTLADAGRALLAAKQFALAKKMFEQSTGVEAEMALADFYLGGAKKEDLGKVAGAFDAAIGKSPERRDLYLREASFLIDIDMVSDAAVLLDRACAAFPSDRAILLRRALTLELAGRSQDAAKSLAEIEGRWPEWYEVWLAQGMILDSHGAFEDARKALATAVELGARVPADLKDALSRLLHGSLSAELR